MLTCLALCAPTTAVLAAGTLAGTSIINVANASYTDSDDVSQTVTSNSVSIRVEEIVDVVISPTGIQPQPVVPGDGDRMLAYRVTNVGNGPEAFALLADPLIGGDAFDPAYRRIVLDADSNGLYDPLIDPVYAPGGEPLLPPDATLGVFVFADVPASLSNGDDGQLGLTATALTGAGAPGTLFAGAGAGGSDAIIGNTGAAATAIGTLLVAAAEPTLIKAAAIDGGSAVRGARVTYTLTANLAGTGATLPVVSDVIPAGTDYVPGSLTLDGAALSDTADADAGRFTGTSVEVALASGLSTPQVITFQVQIQ